MIAIGANIKDWNKELFRHEMLDLHNALRSRYNLPLLVLDDTLSASCERWVASCIKKNKYVHSGNTKVGENIAWRADQDVHDMFALSQAIFKQWQNEETYFTNLKPFPTSWKAGSEYKDITHISQMLWKNSDKIGIGIGRVGHVYFCVTQFTPPGNVVGQYAY